MKFKFRYYAALIFMSAFLTLTINSCDEKKAEGQKDDKAQVNPEDVKKMEQEFKTFAEAIENEIAPIYTKSAEAYWNASISGADEDFAKSAEYEKQFNSILADKEKFAELKKFKESGLIRDELLKRHLDRMYNVFLGNQVDTVKLNAVTELQTEIVKKYNEFRPEVGGKKISDNDVEEILKTEKNSKKLQEAWEASKKIAPVVAEDIIKLVKMRNEIAKELGFNNYHEMSLSLSDQKPEDIAQLFDELDQKTAAAFKELKAEIDAELAKKCNVKPEELMPWHYQNRFFQEAPAIYEINLDPYYEGKDLVELTKKYYTSIGMDINDMVAKSDLFEKEKKNQHAYCIDIDRNTKDIRVLCNVKDNSRWMETMLHEYGHAVYFKYHDPKLPWTLREPAHTFTTEAIAMLFGRMASSPSFMLEMGIINEEEKAKIEETAKKILRLQQLVFSRWSQVMYRFEKGLYENPDQDLNKLWWDLVEKYQMAKMPEGRNLPDWASKTHIASSPCYYHNYHLGELLASQLYYYIKDNVIKAPEGTETSFYGNADAGKYLIDKVFMPGAEYYWNDMIEKATGEKLTAKYYAKQFVD